MDTKRFPSQENLQLFHNLLKYKLSQLQPYDAFIVGDDNALQLVLDYQDELFGDSPIIFLGINDTTRAKNASDHPLISGVIQKSSIKENIELALKFNPKAARITAIVDNTTTGIGYRDQYSSNEALFPNLRFDIIDSSNYSMDEIADLLEMMEDDTILLFLSMTSDKNGRYIPLTEAVALFHDHAAVPVYRTVPGGLGSGILGGKMIDFEETGEIAANMVLQVFQGTPVNQIDVIEDSPSHYILDYQLLKSYDIGMHLVPQGTYFINKKNSFYNQYKLLVLVVSVIIIILLVFSFILVVDNRKRRAVEKALKASHVKLSDAYSVLAGQEEELRKQNETIIEDANKFNLLIKKYELSSSSTNSAVWEMDLRSGDIFFSGNIRSIISDDCKEEMNFTEIIDKYLEPPLTDQLMEAFYNYITKKSSEININLPIKLADHNTKWLLVRAKAIRSITNHTIRLHGILLDITRTKEQEIYIEHIAHHDYLTNLPNRMAFMDKLKAELETNNPLSIIMLDIDNFKEINDTLGHTYGDLLLRDIAERLLSIQTDHTFISRFGGDEFLILLSGENNIDRVEKFIKRIEEHFKKPFYIGRREHFIEFSMGISVFPDDSTNLHQLIMNADTAMYHVKHTVKNSYQFFNERMKESVREKASIETILRKALKEDGFYLVYQPKVKVENCEIEGFEALLRLKEHNIPPAVFIRIAEESNLIFVIGRKVTAQAIAQLARWKQKGFPPKGVSINFSSKQLWDLQYIRFLQETLEHYKVDPNLLEIEITETILFDESNQTINFLHQLKDVGVKIALDDFGTGYSSLNYLTYIPVDHVKLDKSLSDKFLELGNLKVMNSIISLVHSLNLKITAEGIEDRHQFEQLKLSGCDYIQGYYFSRPLEVEHAEEIYNTNLLN